jgi:hypothetical protein
MVNLTREEILKQAAKFYGIFEDSNSAEPCAAWLNVHAARAVNDRLIGQ